MTVRERIRRIRRLARKQSLSFQINEGRCESDNARVILGDDSSFPPGNGSEIPGDTFRAICNDLGIMPADL